MSVRSTRFAAAVLLSGSAALAFAQAYPNRAVTMIVPFPPGASSDSMTRLVAQKFTENTGQNMVVDNRPGGGGATGAVATKNATPDGYTLMMINLGSHAANTVLVDKLPYDPIRDFKPITQTWVFPSVLAIPTNSPAKSVAELVALARSKPGGLNYASQGVGSGGHILGAMFKSSTGAPMVHVPFKGAAPAVVDLMAGRVDYLFSAYASVSAQVKDGRLRLLATTAPSRLAPLPEVPTMAEAGFRDVDLDTWFGVAGPVGMPDALVQRMQIEIEKSVRSPDVVAKMADQGVQAVSSSSAAFGALIARDIERLRALVKELDAKGD